MLMHTYIEEIILDRKNLKKRKVADKERQEKKAKEEQEKNDQKEFERLSKKYKK